MALETITIDLLSLVSVPDAGLTKAVKVVCGLTHVDWWINAERTLTGESGVLDEECCLTFLSFSSVPLQTVPVTCRTQVHPFGTGTPITLWFVAEEFGPVHSSSQSLRDVSFAVTWNISPSSMLSAKEKYLNGDTKPMYVHR
ncbi:hypothetical protein OF83DRAFT_1171468 [Amylostereum chailletii]|nr:hypothetical protein OF83DRAFT_1171468 [Amylostereum chailletii]